MVQLSSRYFFYLKLERIIEIGIHNHTWGTTIGLICNRWGWHPWSGRCLANSSNYDLKSMVQLDFDRVWYCTHTSSATVWPSHRRAPLNDSYTWHEAKPNLIWVSMADRLEAVFLSNWIRLTGSWHNCTEVSPEGTTARRRAACHEGGGEENSSFFFFVLVCYLCSITSYFSENNLQYFISVIMFMLVL
jgi:hypothetical protein